MIRIFTILVLLSLFSIAHGFQIPSVSRTTPRAVDSCLLQTVEVTDNNERRKFLNQILGGSLALVASVASSSAAHALDMDAFVNSQLEADTKNCNPKLDPKCKPKLSEDEALCQYGQSGQARGEACQRVKAAGGTLPKPGSQGKSLGGAYAM